MRIHIAADMEGVGGVTRWDHVTSTHAEYARFRRLMTAEVNAAVCGSFAGGADEVTVSDGHGGGGNLLIEELDERTRLNTGSPAPLSMLQGIGPDVSGVVFVGYHARAGTPRAILDHTWAGAALGLWLNGIEVGEIGLNAAVCGHFGVPVVAISGCAAACAEAAALLGPVCAAPVKWAASRTAAECASPATARRAILEAAREGVSRLRLGQAPHPFVVAPPIDVTIEFTHSNFADGAAAMPGSERDGRKVRCRAADMPEAYRAFRCLMALA
jgi:D-amino peptidase